jgi:5'-nucleotidase
MEATNVAMPPLRRRIFSNRTLNMRSIKAIGYDMDYTLIHYRMEEWERRAYESLKEKLRALEWPVERLSFDPHLVTRGLIIDSELGNIVKANRFGYVIRAFHGTCPVEFERQRTLYARTLVDLAEPRYTFLNTFFSLSEACMYAQLVDLLDAKALPGGLGYEQVYRTIRRLMDEAHMEGELKGAIVANPGPFIEVDEDLALALLDQRAAGKRLMLITNSDWAYSRAMLAYALDPALPAGTTWRDLFEVIIVSARKPDFFSHSMPLFEIASDEGLLRPCPGGLHQPGIYVGGDAGQVERYLGVSGEEILYVGDHLFVDVHVTKDVLRWRTALILRELEEELDAIEAFRTREAELARLMKEKERLEFALSQARLALQRRDCGYGPTVAESAGKLKGGIAELRQQVMELDTRVAPLAAAGSEVLNRNWGLLMRAGNDKSHFARQVERYADVYTSRVSNFLFETPFMYVRSPRGSLPHDEPCR